MAHNIIIINSRITALKGTAVEGDLETLRANAVAIDARIGTPTEGENDHPWIENVESALETMVETVGCLNKECPL